MSDILKEKISGVIYGSALGDGWGAVTEFKTFGEIVPLRPVKIPNPLVITDDTQMSLYTTRALQEISKDYPQLPDLSKDENRNSIRKVFAKHYLEWLYDLDNDRAPGMTCLAALTSYENSHRVTGLEGSHKNNSLGCGTIMRTPWIGLHGGLNHHEVQIIASLQAQVTHGHSEGWLVSSLLSRMIRKMISQDSDFSGLGLIKFARMIFIELAQEDTFCEISDLRNVNEGLAHLENSWKEFNKIHPLSDHCQFYGEGWIAPETLYTALAVVSRFGNNPMEALQKLVETSGDSDSLACIGGSLLGAMGRLSDARETVKSLAEERYKIELSQAFDFYCSTWNLD